MAWSVHEVGAVRRRRRELDAAEWSRVFELRCRSKRGEHLSPEDLALCKSAFISDPERYSTMTEQVFNATKPFGAL